MGEESACLQISLRRALGPGALAPGLVEAVAGVFDRAGRETGGRICLSTAGPGGAEGVGAALVQLLLAAAVHQGAQHGSRTEVRSDPPVYGHDGRCHLLARVTSPPHPPAGRETGPDTTTRPSKGMEPIDAPRVSRCGRSRC